jgi:hypothetical protein
VREKSMVEVRHFTIFLSLIHLIVYSKTEYYFVDHETFEENIAKGEFIEFTKFSNNYYGTRY